MPNRLRYCGGDDNRTLFEYGIASTAELCTSFTPETCIS
jgi:hypothetical protein